MGPARLIAVSSVQIVETVKNYYRRLNPPDAYLLRKTVAAAVVTALPSPTPPATTAVAVDHHPTFPAKRPIPEDASVASSAKEIKSF
jgi:hypothetical protein